MMVSKCNGMQKWLTIIGSLLLMLPIGLPWYWGNMSVYALSFIAKRGDNKEIETPWIISFYFLFNTVGLFLAGFVSKYSGKRLMLFLGIVMHLCGIFLTYFSVKRSVLLVNATIGFVAGLGGGFINGMALQYAVQWADRDLGFVTSFVQSGFNAGPVFINPFVTMYVNPDNTSPDVDMDQTKLFSQPEILDRVPSLFLSFGILCCCFQFVGFLLVRDLDPYDNNQKQDSRCIINNSKVGTELQTLSPHKNSTPDGPEKTPIEMVRTKSFYCLLFSLMIFDNAMLVLANYYKQYGAECINNDHFLTFLGTVLTLSMIFAFPAWGFLSDKIGVKKSLIQMHSASSVLYFFMYFAPLVNKWAYMAIIALQGWFLPPIFSILIIATCKLFGKRHYSSNIGLVCALSLLMNFVNPLIFEKILKTGWFYVFCYAGCLTTVSLIIIVTSLPSI